MRTNARAKAAPSPDASISVPIKACNHRMEHDINHNAGCARKAGDWRLEGLRRKVSGKTCAHGACILQPKNLTRAAPATEGVRSHFMSHRIGQMRRHFSGHPRRRCNEIVGLQLQWEAIQTLIVTCKEFMIWTASLGLSRMAQVI